MSGRGLVRHSDTRAGSYRTNNPPVPRTSRSREHSLQEKIFSAWLKFHLDRAGVDFRDISVDLRDGVNLLKLIEVLAGPEHSAAPERGVLPIHQVNTVRTALRCLRKLNVDCLVAPEQIVSGDMKSTLALVWQIILSLDLNTIHQTDHGRDVRAQDAILLWAKKATKEYPGVEVNNLHSSWLDGMAFATLLHHYHPDAIDLDSLDPSNAGTNFEQAFRAARALGIPEMMAYPADFSGSRLDKKALETMLSCWYRHLEGKALTPAKSSGSSLVSPSRRAGLSPIPQHEEDRESASSTPPPPPPPPANYPGMDSPDNSAPVVGRTGNPIPQEKLQHLRELFELVDDDHDGRITGWNLRRLIQDQLLEVPDSSSPARRRSSAAASRRKDLLRHRLSGEDFGHLLMENLDQDGDGQLSFPEFAVAFEEVFDDRGGFSQAPTLYRAETKALGQIVNDLMEELETEKEEKENLKFQLESKAQAMQSRVDESMLAADAHLNEAEEQAQHLERENQKLKSALEASEVKRAGLEEELLGQMQSPGTSNRNSILLDDLRDENGRLKREIEAMNVEKDRATTTTDQKEAELRRLKAAMDRDAEALEELQRRALRHEEDLGVASAEAQRARELQGEVDLLQERLRQAKERENRANRLSLSDLAGNDRERALGMSIGSELAAATANDESELLKEELAELRAALTDAQHKAEVADRKATGLREQLHAATVAQAHKTDLPDTAAMQRRLDRQNETIQDLEDATSALRLQVQDMEAEALEANRVALDTSTLLAANQGAEVELERLRSENRRVKTELERAQQEDPTALKRTIRNLELQLNNVERRAVGLEDALAAQDRSPTRNPEEEERMQRAYQRSIDGLQQSNFDKDSELADLRSRLRDLGSQHQRAQDEIEELKGFARVQIDVHKEVLHHRTMPNGRFDIVDQQNSAASHTWFMADGVDQVNNGPWTREEDRVLLDMANVVGQDWVEIAKELPGRTNTVIQSRWETLQSIRGDGRLPLEPHRSVAAVTEPPRPQATRPTPPMGAARRRQRARTPLQYPQYSRSTGRAHGTLSGSVQVVPDGPPPAYPGQAAGGYQPAASQSRSHSRADSPGTRSLRSTGSAGGYPTNYGPTAPPPLRAGALYSTPQGQAGGTQRPVHNPRLPMSSFLSDPNNSGYAMHLQRASAYALH